MSRKNDQRSLWQPQHKFHLRPHRLTNFAARNRDLAEVTLYEGKNHQSTDKVGRISLTDTKFTETAGRKRIERHVKSTREFEKILQKDFGYV